MSRIRLTLAGGDYDLTRALIEGEVQAAGIDLTYLPLNAPDIFRRMLRYEEFDASEMSMSSLLIAREQGKRFVAIPVFPVRKFRHSYIFCNSNSGISTPQDLIGKKVGAREYQLTANLWARGMLKHEYDIEPEEMHWFTQWEERIPLRPMEGLSLTRIQEGRLLDTMLVDGDLDALIWPNIPPSVRSKSPLVRRLFENYPVVEAEYFRKTGLFPIMHTVVIRQEVYQRDPWVAPSLLEAYRRAKEVCYERMEDASKDSLVWFVAAKEEEERVFGGDPYPYDLRENRRTLETLIQYSVEQGLTTKAADADDLFAKNTLDE